MDNPVNKDLPPNTFCILGGHPLVKPSRADWWTFLFMMVVTLPFLYLFKLTYPDTTVDALVGMLCASSMGALCAMVGITMRRGWTHYIVLSVAVIVAGLVGRLVSLLVL